MMRRTGKRAFVPATATDDIGGGGITNSLLLSNIASVLPEQVQSFLDWPVRIGKQHGVGLLRFVPHAMPRRDAKNVALGPFDDEILARPIGDDTAPASLDRHDDCRIRRT